MDKNKNAPQSSRLRGVESVHKRDYILILRVFRIPVGPACCPVSAISEGAGCLGEFLVGFDDALDVAPGHSRPVEDAVLVGSEREERAGERRLGSVGGICLVVVELIFIDLVEVRASDGHAGEDVVLQFHQTFRGRALCVTLFIVEDDTDRPAHEDAVENVEAMRCLHFTVPPNYS